MKRVSKEQVSFLTWLYHNYSWMVSRGYTPNTIAFQSVILRIVRDGEYGTMDKEMIEDSIRFLRGRGLKTYSKYWRWKEDSPELDYLVNIKSK
jgi:hypothetical protein